jgi:membrane associated rhomboid family serine protease
MVFAPVGIRCPEHAGVAQGPRRVVQQVERRAVASPGIVTKTLIGVNVAIFLLNLAQGASLGRNAGELFLDGALYGPAVADGDWWRLITAAFLHGSIVHLLFNMFMLYLIGTPMEMAIGPFRYIGLYVASALAGSAGALVLSPEAVTVGASGAIFGILGAAVVFERQGYNVLGGSALGTVVLNLAFTFAVPNISIGGHVGGLIGGALVGLALSRFGRGHAAYGRLGVVGFGAIAAVCVLSVLVSMWKVAPYA